MDNAENILSVMELSTPATQEMVASCEDHIGRSLPSDYRAFLLRSDGAEGFVEGRYIALWGCEMLSRINNDIDLSELIPNCMLFGSDGGETYYAYDLHDSDQWIVSFEFAMLETRYANKCCNDLDRFLIGYSRGYY